MKSNIAVVCLDYKLALDVAKILAEELDMYFLDIQGLYEFDIKPRTISETIKKYGMDYYRKEISGSIKYASTFENAIMSIESGAVDISNVGKLRKHCLLIYIRTFPSWVENKDFKDDYKSAEEKKLYKVSGVDIITRDKFLCKHFDITVYGDDNDTKSFANNAIDKIKQYYGV